MKNTQDFITALFMGGSDAPPIFLMICLYAILACMTTTVILFTLNFIITAIQDWMGREEDEDK